MKTKFFYLAMYILAVLPLMTACESDEPTAIDEPNEQTQLATPVVTVNVDINAKTITASWQAVEHADNYHYQISGDETLYKTGETRLELQPYSKFEGGSHSITVQAVSNAQPGLFSPSEWGKADFSVGSAKLQAPDALNADVDKESCTVTVTWAPVANAASYLYKIDDGKEVPVSEPGISFSLFDYAPGEHSVSVKALAEGDAPTGRSASVKAVTAVASSDWSEVYTFTITDEPLPGMLGNKPLDHARLGDFYLNDGSLLRGDSELSAELADACIGIVFYAGRHETDQSDYTRPLTEGGPVLGSTVHGYVVSLTHAPSRWYYAQNRTYDDWGYWEYFGLEARACNATSYQDPWGFGSPVLAADLETRKMHNAMYMGTIDSEDDFNGYYNCMAILEYLKGMNCCLCPPLEVAINYGKKSIGWRWRDDGLVGYTENPMIRTDETDKYEWQLSLAAPQSSSGWFLPSYGQIAYADIGYHLNRPDVWDFMVGQFDKVKNATTREGLKWKIREVNAPIDPDWDGTTDWFDRLIFTSSEEKDGSASSLREYAGDGDGDRGIYVRPVLAF